MNPLVKEVRTQRRGRKISQMDVASRVGVHVDTIVAWEKGESSPVLNNFQALIHALGGRLTIEWASK